MKLATDIDIFVSKTNNDQIIEASQIIFLVMKERF